MNKQSTLANKVHSEHNTQHLTYLPINFCSVSEQYNSLHNSKTELI